jgi:ankyrin repeat protein/L-ascorbate metabolism protein UlaG (beta-lactamase superfamily)
VFIDPEFKSFHMKNLLIAILAAAFLSGFGLRPALSQDIFSAIQEGNLAAVTQLVDQDPGVLALRNPDHLTPLNLAASDGQLEIASFLLQRGADPAAGDRENSQPIHLAALNGHIDMVDMLLDHKIDIDTKDDNLMTPLLFAVSRGQAEMARHLIDRGADVRAKNNNGFGSLLMAAISGNTDLVRLFVESGAKVSEKSNAGFTALHSAASYGRTDIVKYLLEKGADIEAVTHEGTQPLALAVGRNSYDAAVMLIEKGADVNHKDHNGFTALHEAAGRGNIPVARLLIEHGADLNAATPDGFVPLAYAAFPENAGEMARFLILSGADVNPDPCKSNKSCTCGPNFRTPLHAACDMAKLEVVKILVENGARVNLFSNIGLTPLHYAVKNGNEEIVDYLLEHGAFLNVKDNREGWSELHLAAALGYSGVASLLLEKGSSPQLKNNMGQTPLEFAFYYGQDRIGYEMLASGTGDFDLKSYINSECMLSRSYGPGQAEVWYLGHSGWAVKTQHHLLVFDYFINPRVPEADHACLNAGCIDPNELQHVKMDVFSTHAHADHYNKSYFDWDDQNPDVTYIFGHEPADVTDGYIYTPVHAEAEIDGMQIYVIQSTDGGGGFLVGVDGLTLFFMGDHANGSDDLSKEFTDEIDLIAKREAEIDILFTPIRGCSLGTPEQVKAGIYYTLEKLQPSLYVPMHSGVFTTENKAFTEQAVRDGIKVPFRYTVTRGDRFFYDKSQLTNL